MVKLSPAGAPPGRAGASNRQQRAGRGEEGGQQLQHKQRQNAVVVQERQGFLPLVRRRPPRHFLFVTVWHPTGLGVHLAMLPHAPLDHWYPIQVADRGLQSREPEWITLPKGSIPASSKVITQRHPSPACMKGTIPSLPPSLPPSFPPKYMH